MESYGWIVEDKTLAPVLAEIKFYNTRTGEVFWQGTADHFHVWTNLDATTAVNDDDVQLQIKAAGFDTYRAKASMLNPQNDVYLKKSAFPYLRIIAAGALLAYAAKNKKKVGELSQTDLKLIAVAFAGVLSFDLIKRTLEGLGIWDSQSTKQLDSVSTNPESFWNPNFWRNVNPSGTGWSYAIDTNTARQWIADLRDAFGPFNDNEEQAIGVLKRCRTQANLSFLADIFNRDSGEDLLTWLRGGWWPQDRLSDTDVATITNYISKLPKY